MRQGEREYSCHFVTTSTSYHQICR